MGIRGGIYKIQNTENGKRYIGSAVNFARRFRRHRAELRSGTHHSRKLQNAWNKYGAGAFVFVPMLVCDPVDLRPHEQLAIDGLKPEYNIAKSAAMPMLGMKHTPAGRAKIAAARTGQKMSAETRAKISVSSTGKKVSVETRAKMAAAWTPERRAKTRSRIMAPPGGRHTRILCAMI